ncbi:DHH phosphoesterase [Metschnikowia bicuspidata]|uniref:DHH phosphoesterase n=1 Tax=Metschnikowia bicuspidata TaxID=27322 RepID=A0A4P9Z745_9ASCO|nr:DHH phosphoesterase [Metschnikowia bicuspidata]
MSLKSFLVNVKNTPVAGPVVRLVTGNQSCDMDSISSAIAYAFFRNKYPGEELYRPVLNIPREQLRLRKDVVLFLQAHDVGPADLYFLEDVAVWQKQLPHAAFDVALVDHCNIQGAAFAALHEEGRVHVTAIIDHHEDEGVFLDASPRVIYPAGLCTSLVFQHWNSMGVRADCAIVNLLLALLLIDTDNMRQKVQPCDEEARAAYRRLLAQQDACVASKGQLVVRGEQDNFCDVYRALKAAKKDMAGLLAHDVLAKDFKLFDLPRNDGCIVRFGFSSVPKPASWLFSSFTAADWTAALEMIQTEHGLDAMVVTTSFHRADTDEHARELCYYPVQPQLADVPHYASLLALDERVFRVDSIGDALGEINAQLPLRVYNMGNTSASRKQVVPLLREIVRMNF